MKKALVLKDKSYTVVLREEDKYYISLGEFLFELSTSQEIWKIKYVDLISEGLITLKELSPLLDGSVIEFRHLEKYSADIKNFIC